MKNLWYQESLPPRQSCDVQMNSNTSPTIHGQNDLSFAGLEKKYPDAYNWFNNLSNYERYEIFNALQSRDLSI